jgi:hypothetical protein
VLALRQRELQEQNKRKAKELADRQVQNKKAKKSK